MNARIFAAAVSIVSACAPKQKDQTPPDAGPTLIGPESVAVARRQWIATGPRVAGSLQPQRQSVIRAEVGGSILEVRAEIGQPVKLKDILVRFEDSAIRDAYISAQSALRSAQNDHDLANKQLERTTKLVEAGALAERDREAAQSALSGAEARVADAKARLAQAKKQLDAVSVEAPIEGVVAKRDVNQGDVVAPGAALFTVIDPSSMRLEASVTSEELSQVVPNAPVEFEVRGYPGQTFTGTIDRVAPAADPITRQIPILVSIPNPGGKLVAGLFAEGRVATSRREALVVPASAVEEIAGQANVVVVRNGAVERIEVQLGLRDDRTEKTEILSGINEGDRVLLGGARRVSPGIPVQLTSSSTVAEAAAAR